MIQKVAQTTGHVVTISINYGEKSEKFRFCLIHIFSKIHFPLNGLKKVIIENVVLFDHIESYKVFD